MKLFLGGYHVKNETKKWPRYLTCFSLTPFICIYPISNMYEASLNFLRETNKILWFVIYRDVTQATTDTTFFEFNMSALSALLRRQAEQNPTASYFNVDILKYQIKGKDGAGSCPFQLVAYWKCNPTHTDIKVSIYFLNNLQFIKLII